MIQSSQFKKLLDEKKRKGPSGNPAFKSLLTDYKAKQAVRQDNSPASPPAGEQGGPASDLPATAPVRQPDRTPASIEDQHYWASVFDFHRLSKARRAQGGPRITNLPAEGLEGVTQRELEDMQFLGSIAEPDPPPGTFTSPTLPRGWEDVKHRAHTVLAPHPTEWIVDFLEGKTIPTGPFMALNTAKGRGVLLGLGDLAQGLSTPFNLALLLTLPVATSVRLLKIMVETGFSVHMFKQVLDAAPEALDLLRDGKEEEGMRALTNAFGSAALATLLGASAVKHGKRWGQAWKDVRARERSKPLESAKQTELALQIREAHAHALARPGTNPLLDAQLRTLQRAKTAKREAHLDRLERARLEKPEVRGQMRPENLRRFTREQASTLLEELAQKRGFEIKPPKTARRGPVPGGKLEVALDPILRPMEVPSQARGSMPGPRSEFVGEMLERVRKRRGYDVIEKRGATRGEPSPSIPDFKTESGLTGPMRPVPYESRLKAHEKTKLNPRIEELREAVRRAARGETFGAGGGDVMAAAVKAMPEFVRKALKEVADVEDLLRVREGVERTVIASGKDMIPPPEGELVTQYSNKVKVEGANGIVGRLNRKYNSRRRAEEGAGDRCNDMVVLRDPETGYDHAFGKVDFDTWLRTGPQILTPEQLAAGRRWYGELREIFTEYLSDVWGEKAPNIDKWLEVWALSQQHAPPSQGMMNVNRASDLSRGLPRIKQAGLSEKAMVQSWLDVLPESGYGQKLLDFMDATFEKTFRTVMGNDPRGLGPSPIDAWASRDLGFIDSALKGSINRKGEHVPGFVEKKWGKEVADKLEYDFKGAPSETQYEFGNEFYNRAAERLNQMKYDGGNWTPAEAQAVGWLAVQKRWGQKFETPRDIFEKNLHHMPTELAFGENSPLSREFPSLYELPYNISSAITKQVMDKVVPAIAADSNVSILRSRTRYGPGGYTEVPAEGKPTVYPSQPSNQITVMGSPESIAAFRAGLGLVLEQTEMISIRPLKSGKTTGLDIKVAEGNRTFGELDFAKEFGTRLQKDSPLHRGKPDIQGYSISPVGDSIRIYTRSGKWIEGNKRLNSVLELVEKLEKEYNVDISVSDPFNVDLASTMNNWGKFPKGENYAKALRDLGRRDLLRAIDDTYRGSVRKWITEAFEEHSPGSLNTENAAIAESLKKATVPKKPKIEGAKARARRAARRAATGQTAGFLDPDLIAPMARLAVEYAKAGKDVVRELIRDAAEVEIKLRREDLAKVLREAELRDHEAELTTISMEEVLQYQAMGLSQKASKLADQFQTTNMQRAIALEQAERVKAEGTIDASLRETWRKGGTPSQEQTYQHEVSRQLIEESAQLMVETARAYKKAESQYRAVADANSAEIMSVARGALDRAVKEWQTYRAAWGRAGQAFQQPIPDNVIQALREAELQTEGLSRNAKERIPILVNIGRSMRDWKDLNKNQKMQVVRDLIDGWRFNLFTITSWTLDFIGNAAEAAVQTAEAAARDVGALSRGNGNMPFTQGILRAMRHNRPTYRRGQGVQPAKPIPSEIAEGLQQTVSGEILPSQGVYTFRRGVAPEGSLTRKVTKIGSQIVDYGIAGPLYAKGIIDTFSKRMGAMSTIYGRMVEAANERKLSGADRKHFYENYLENIPEKVIDEALINAKKAGYSRELTWWEEKFSTSPMVKLFFSPFPRWNFQFARWSGEMLGANPRLWRKVAKGQATREDVMAYLTRSATGWGALYLLNEYVYEHVNPFNMEWEIEEGHDPLRLQGREPIPSALWFLGALKMDHDFYWQGLKNTSLPLAQFIGDSRGGLLLEIRKRFIEANENPQNDPRALRRTIENIVNRAFPGQAILTALESALDPTLREGLGSNIPGYSSTLPAKIDPTTGEDLKPMQKIKIGPWETPEFPMIAGAPIPGATRITNKIEDLLRGFGYAVYRGPRISVAGYPPGQVPEEYRREWQREYGRQVNALLQEEADKYEAGEYNQITRMEYERVRSIISKRRQQASRRANNFIREKYGAQKVPRERRPLSRLERQRPKKRRQQENP